ncbi:hypothetical protein ANCDUO_09465 [Ancylostoma duodenale]|uniref:SCP domain-containing protein n=1 Tax=Ancylostoma duodenale TaxID=51022 RepID=A0A0C2CTQ9_9BILA|nr:hypothetical protein ANCDUO_09465 [Ancylostoma duodenale]
MTAEHDRYCRVSANFRKVFDDFHNELRQKVAGGIPINYQHFQKRLMYGLIYDCKYEVKAAIESRNPGSVKGHGIITFIREYDGSVLKAIKEGFEALLENRRALIQLIYPKSTRFGCWGTLNGRGENGKRRAQVTCVYDKKRTE